MIKFRQKNFNILTSTLSGAGLGATVGSGISIFKPRKEKDGEFYTLKDEKGNPKFDQNAQNRANNFYRMKVVGFGMLVGAALGALYGTFKEITKKINRRNTVDKRIMEKVIFGLKSSGFKEGKDFTRDPKQANEMKTKVCIVISKYSGELRLLINVAKDRNLEQLALNIVKNIPNASNVVTRTGDKYNDIIVSTISDPLVEDGLICGIVEKFIHNKYQVYLVEVG